MHFNIKNDKNFCYPELYKFSDKLIELLNRNSDGLLQEAELPLVIYLGLYPNN